MKRFFRMAVVPAQTTEAKQSEQRGQLLQLLFLKETLSITKQQPSHFISILKVIFWNISSKTSKEMYIHPQKHNSPHTHTHTQHTETGLCILTHYTTHFEPLPTDNNTYNKCQLSKVRQISSERAPRFLHQTQRQLSSGLVNIDVKCIKMIEFWKMYIKNAFIYIYSLKVTDSWFIFCCSIRMSSM